MNRIRIVIFLFALWPATSFAQKNVKVDLKKLDKYYQQMVKDWDVPSASIGIVKDGKLIFSKSYGEMEVGKAKKPNSNSLYAIASNSKAFTSALVGILVQEGKLSWDDKVKKHLPYFELYDPWVSNEITIRDLLCHRSGLGTFSGDVIWYKANLSAEEIIQRAKHIPPAFDFRTGYGYSNLMFITAGEIIEKVTGESWSKNVQVKILDPLGMSRTITSPRNLESKGNYATPHGREGAKNVAIPWENWENIAAMGGIISSVEDIAKWMIFNLNNGIINNDTILSRNTRNTVWTPHNNFTVDHTKKNDFDRHFNAYGLGWGLSDYHGKLRVGHTGGYDGMITAVTMIPDENLGIVVLTNGMKSPIMAATYHAFDQFLGIKGDNWSEKLLKKSNDRKSKDKRVDHIKLKKIANTNPSLPLDKYAGTYYSDIYGKIMVTLDDDQLKLNFEHSPSLSANLHHWHYDVWEIVWDQRHAWFDFGTLKFNTNNNIEIKSIDFEVPNNDIFFEELKPYRVE